MTTPYSFKAYTLGLVIDRTHKRHREYGIICGFVRDADSNIIKVRIQFAPYGPHAPEEWFTPDQVEGGQ